MEQLQLLNLCLTVVLLALIAYQGKETFIENAGEEVQFITSPLTSLRESTEASRKLKEFATEEFEKPEVIKVSDKVHVAVGFGAANSALIEGDGGLIIVDTTEGEEPMEEIMSAFRKLTDKPVKAIILSHFHADHIAGVHVIMRDGKKRFPNQKIDIYAHERTKKLMTVEHSVQDITFIRGVRQFGPLLRGEVRPIISIGKNLRVSKSFFELSPPEPTVTYKDRETYTVAGVTFDLISTPGETDDQTTTWIPSERVVLSGDNMYKAFPNLYAIRGQASRDCKQWYRSLDKVRSLKARCLVAGHTRPVIGAEAVENALIAYRDAIKYIHDQTVRYMNKGYLSEDIVRKVTLPDYLASHPFLQEHYGTVNWSVRGVFTDYMGWFSGNPADLEPMHSNIRGSKLIDMLSGVVGNRAKAVNVVLQVAQDALQRSRENYLASGKHIVDDEKWALELANTVLALDDSDAAQQSAAKIIKVSSLRSLGIEHSSTNGRNYYLVTSLETEKSMALQRPPQSRSSTWKTSSIDAGLEMFCLKVKGLECQSHKLKVSLNFTDLGKKYSLNLRNGVCDVIAGGKRDGNISVSVISQTWKSYLAGATTADQFSFTLGTRKDFENFMDCFDPMI